MKVINSVVIFVFVVLTLSCDTQKPVALEWPTITRENKPWTRWWWEGSAVTKEGITAELEAFKKVGLGGVEITPIYGVYGEENKFISYLSPQWVEMLEHTLSEAERLDLGVDMATGTGWPFGGPWVSAEDACKNINYKTFEVREGESLKESIVFHQESLVRSVGMQIYEMQGIYKVDGQPLQGTVQEPVLKKDIKKLTIDQLVEPISANKNLQALALDQIKFDKMLKPAVVMAYSDKGEKIDITKNLDAKGMLHWKAGAGNWTVYAIFPGWHGKMVERAAPGGEGDVIDHFSEKALTRYLSVFDTALEGRNMKGLRGYFNDSYEVDDARGAADWTDDLFSEFKARRGYDLQNYLPALFGKDTDELNARILCDYRETISELIYDKFTSVWHNWANKQGKIVRNQAHGSPSNILDLYAEVDIPEIEGEDALRIKMASSASNVTGKKLTSSESATWLNEHFESNLSDIKEALDRFMVNGVNHMFYHGTCYSPQGEPWPGWLFYAAIHMNPRNPLWTDAGKLNGYVGHCQSFLQNSTPDNDVLLYYPIYDRFSTQGRELIEHFDGVEKQFEGTAFKEGAEEMLSKGFLFDYISDKQIQQLTPSADNKIRSGGGNSYKTLVVPQCQYIPVNTLEKIIALAEAGSTVIFYKGLPSTFSGFSNRAGKEKSFESLISKLSFESNADGISQVILGKGKILMGDDLSGLLTSASLKRELLADMGLQFIRKHNEAGEFYLITNWSDKAIDTWIPLSREFESAAVFNPINNEIGIAKSRKESGVGEIYLQMEKGETLIVQTYSGRVSGKMYPYFEKVGEPTLLEGTWKVTFDGDSSTRPNDISVSTLTSWTEFEGAKYDEFSGTATYSADFGIPGKSETGWLLDLGQVNESAKVSVNGVHVATLMGPVYQVYVDNSLLNNERNQLEVSVSNTMANHISAFDRKGVFWKKFYNVNFPARLAENRENGIFSAKAWSPRPSGLLGPVQWIAVKRLH